ncbi:MAG: class I SAM-dependent methyltransferase, partial [Porphyromonas sp.]|nr:class I SAM-dependent methyltransferase [Porphyromonas sp.]
MISGQSDKTESELLALEEYISEHISPEPPLLKKLYRDAHIHLVRPRMMSGHHQGRLLALLSKIKSPRHIVEIGTYTGYATLCLAEGLPQNGIIHTIELNDEMEEFLERYFNQSEYKEQIRIYFGDALEILPTLPLEETDIVYIDANKRHYID